MAKTSAVNLKEVEGSLRELFDASNGVVFTSDANGYIWNAFVREDEVDVNYTVTYRNGNINVYDKELGISRNFTDTDLGQLRDYIGSLGLQPVEAGSRFSDMPNNFTEDAVYYTYSFRGDNTFGLNIGYGNGFDAEIFYMRDGFMGSDFSNCELHFSDKYGEWHQEPVEIINGIVVVSDNIVPKNYSVEEIEKIISQVHTLSMADCVDMLENPDYYAEKSDVFSSWDSLEGVENEGNAGGNLKDINELDS